LNFTHLKRVSSRVRIDLQKPVWEDR
jgi:hypothetical protein